MIALHGNNIAMNRETAPVESQPLDIILAGVDRMGLPERDVVAIKFAIRCGYGLGYEDGRDSKRRAA